MGNALLLGGRHLVGSDVETAVDRGRITADDLAVAAVRQCEAQRALARGGRADDRDEARRHPAYARANAYIASRVSTRNSPSCCVRVAITASRRREAIR